LRRTFISGTQATAEKKAHLRNLCFNHRKQVIFFDGPLKRKKGKTQAERNRSEETQPTTLVTVAQPFNFVKFDPI